MEYSGNDNRRNTRQNVPYRTRASAPSGRYNDREGREPQKRYSTRESQSQQERYRDRAVQTPERAYRDRTVQTPERAYRDRARQMPERSYRDRASQGAKRSMDARSDREYARQREAAAKSRRPHKTQRFITQYDFALLFITIGIALFGVVMIYSAGYYTASLRGDPLFYVKSQVRGLVLGLVAMLIISKFDYQYLMHKFKPFKISIAQFSLIVAYILQIMVLFVGVERNGARRWLDFKVIQFQPSEISKIATILFLAYAIYKNRKALDDKWGRGAIRLLIYIGPLAVFILLENMSSAIIVGTIFFAMCLVASRKKGYFAIAALALVGAGAIFILVSDPFRMERIRMWLDVENNDAAFQIRQGLYAVASGGLFGKGLGRSMQKLGFIPEAYNDMIFSVICEELGIVGATIVILVFIALLWRIVMIACHAPDMFGTMICVGVLVQLAVQVLINVAVVTNTIPSTGIPLPLISFGGTSATIIMAEIGLVLSVSRQIKQK